MLHITCVAHYLCCTPGAASFMFDFPLKGVLNEAASKCEYWRLADAENKAPGLNGWWAERSCLFVDNHDTYGWLNPLGVE